MADFPSNIPKPSSIDRGVSQPALRSEFEANYGIVRPKVSRSRNRFRLTWNPMRRADFSILLQFFEANQGTAFNWRNPLDNVTRTVTFSDDVLEERYVSRVAVNCTVNLEEI